MSVQEISLSYTDGSSDKAYHAQIEQMGDLYTVNFQYGRRGSTLQTGIKCQLVSREVAQKTFDKLVQEKTSKGYTTAASGTPYVGTEKAGELFGYVPQLLNAVDESHVLSLLEDNNWFMQEKKDGVRQIIKRTTVGGNTIQGGNRKGLCVAVSAPISNAVMSLHTKRDADFVLDGEAMGDVYWPFDILRYDGRDTTGMPVENRWSLLEGLLGTTSLPAIGFLTTAYTSETKHALFDKIKAERGEGVVFKKLGSKYVPGRPNSGGNQLKFKFTESATVFVRGQNTGKRSVMIDAGWGTFGAKVGVGNVTIPVNYEIPADGSLVEVGYLYAYQGGSLYQPTYKGPRPDKDTPDHYDSLKFKQGTGEDDDA